MKEDISILAGHQIATAHTLLVLTADYALLPNMALVFILEELTAVANFKPLAPNDYGCCTLQHSGNQRMTEVIALNAAITISSCTSLS
jgi:hypothetical protein